jgi:hypothetical protein
MPGEAADRESESERTRDEGLAHFHPNRILLKVDMVLMPSAQPIGKLERMEKLVSASCARSTNDFDGVADLACSGRRCRA